MVPLANGCRSFCLGLKEHQWPCVQFVWNAISENLHGGGAECQADKEGAEGRSQAGQARGAKEAAPSPGTYRVAPENLQQMDSYGGDDGVGGGGDDDGIGGNDNGVGDGHDGVAGRDARMMKVSIL